MAVALGRSVPPIVTASAKWRKFARLHEAETESYRASGVWDGRTVEELLNLQCELGPDRVAIVDGGEALTFQSLRARSRIVARRLSELGVTQGDIVSMQLPNWHEAVTLIVATGLLGAVINPIVPIYRDAEVGFILNDAKPQLFVIPETFRNFDHSAMADRLLSGVGSAGQVLVIRRGGGVGSLFAEPTEQAGRRSAPAVDPDAVRLLMYTSGTTGFPKGVLHSSNTLGAEIAAVTDYWKITADDVVLMPSPLTHITGFLYGVELPLRSGSKAVLMDSWNPDVAVDLIEAHGVTMIVGATPFLTELVDCAERRGKDLPTLRLFACGGAPVAPSIIDRAHRVLGNCLAMRVYGSTEAPTITLGVQSRSDRRLAAETEGQVVGHTVKLLNVARTTEDHPGEEGEIAVRGPELFLGYFNPADEVDAFTADGFFKTGDLARYTAEGMLVITGRKKDLIIRGGENIAPKEIEDVLLSHHEVVEVAVVAMPSARLGETVCAFVVPRSGGALAVSELLDHVRVSGIAKQKWPERFIFVENLPKTAAGKVRKDLLRAQL